MGSTSAAHRRRARHRTPSIGGRENPAAPGRAAQREEWGERERAKKEDKNEDLCSITIMHASPDPPDDGWVWE